MQIKKYLSILCFVLLFTLLVGCTTNSQANKMVGLEVDEETFQEEVVINEFNIRTWKLKEVYSDGGFTYVDFSYSMLSTEDIAKLVLVGTHTLTFTHKGKSCEFILTIKEPSEEEILSKLNKVAESLTVPTKTDKNFSLVVLEDGVTINWASSSDVIEINKSNAVVLNKGETDAVVCLTATLSYYNQTLEKEFEVVVEATNNYSGVEYVGTYYDSANLELDDNDLLLELRKLITETHTKEVTYGELRYMLDDTDGAEEDESKVQCLYSQVLFSGTWDGGNSWNREHVWPKSLSWFPTVNNSTKGAGADLHHIRPEDNRVNSVRNNDKFGEVNGGVEVTTSTGQKTGCYSGGGYFEPQDSAKGDTARIIFYLFVRYSEADSYDFTAVAQSLEMLLEWNRLDPVDEWEMERNDETAKIQGNRNPFIDYPELAEIIWG